MKDLESITISPLQADVLKTSVETGMELVWNWYGIGMELVWNGMEFCGILWTNWNYARMDFLA